MIVCPACATPMLGKAPRCRRCGFSAVKRDGIVCYLDRQQPENPTTAAYYENYDAISAHDLRHRMVSADYAAEMDAVMAAFVGNVRNVAVCDLGCGRGMLSRALAEKGAASITAVDISLRYLRQLRGIARIEPVLADAEALPFQSEFDVVVSTDVLEHVINPGSFFYCLNRALRMNGRAYVRVPYRENLMPYSPHLGCQYRFVHLRTFDRRLLRQAFRDAGFEVVDSKLCGFFFGRSRRFWTRSQLLMNLYIRLRDRMARQAGGESRVAGWPYWLAGLLMEPVTIMIAARKMADLQQSRADQMTMKAERASCAGSSERHGTGSPRAEKQRSR